MAKLTIATRGSALALAQSYEVRSQLMRHHADVFTREDDIELLPIRTTGDEITSKPLSDIGGKALFTKEIDEALIDGRADLAVHSMKDLPTQLPEGIQLSCVPKREEANDAFICRRYETLSSLPKGARVGTSSLRRKAQLLRLRPDLEVVDFRGNIDTRMRKISDNEGGVVATLLAVCGLKRSHKTDAISDKFFLETILPAVGQGALAITTRTEDHDTQLLLQPFHHEESAFAVVAERTLLAVLNGNCTTPIAAHARLKDDLLLLQARLLSTDGKEMIELSDVCPPEDAALMGRRMGEKMLAIAPPYLLPENHA
jgi:hydroxymethylbilane synthase